MLPVADVQTSQSQYRRRELGFGSQADLGPGESAVSEQGEIGLLRVHCALTIHSLRRYSYILLLIIILFLLLIFLLILLFLPFFTIHARRRRAPQAPNASPR